MKVVIKEFEHVERHPQRFEHGVSYPAQIERIPTGKEWEVDLPTEKISGAWDIVIGEFQT